MESTSRNWGYSSLISRMGQEGMHFPAQLKLFVLPLTLLLIIYQDLNHLYRSASDDIHNYCINSNSQNVIKVNSNSVLIKYFKSVNKLAELYSS